MTIPHPAALGDELQTAVYRLAQEGLNNVHKHSRIDKAELSVCAEDGEVRLLVRDEGVGFEPKIVGRGFGLTGMQERAATLGGEPRDCLCAGGGHRGPRPGAASGRRERERHPPQRRPPGVNLNAILIRL